MTKKIKNDTTSPPMMLIINIVGIFFTWSIWSQVTDIEPSLGTAKDGLPKILLAFIAIVLASVNIFLLLLGYRAASRLKESGWQIFYIFLTTAFTITVGIAILMILFMEPVVYCKGTCENNFVPPGVTIQ